LLGDGAREVAIAQAVIEGDAGQVGECDIVGGAKRGCGETILSEVGGKKPKRRWRPANEGSLFADEAPESFASEGEFAGDVAQAGKRSA
jgi:hypothetical protein